MSLSYILYWALMHALPAERYQDSETTHSLLTLLLTLRFFYCSRLHCWSSPHAIVTNWPHNQLSNRANKVGKDKWNIVNEILQYDRTVRADYKSKEERFCSWIPRSALVLKRACTWIFVECHATMSKPEKKKVLSRCVVKSVTSISTSVRIRENVPATKSLVSGSFSSSKNSKDAHMKTRTANLALFSPPPLFFPSVSSIGWLRLLRSGWRARGN